MTTETNAKPTANGVNLPALPAAPGVLPNAERAGQIIEAVIATGDLKELSGQQRARYYVALCQSLGLNPMTKPFEYITAQGKLVLYPNKGTAEQLGRVYGVSTEIKGRETDGGLHIVTVRAWLPNGRSNEAVGIVPLDGKRGEDLANAYMKAETKAKRRAILSLIGLGWLDQDADRFSADTRQEYVDRHGNVAIAGPARELPPDEIASAVFTEQYAEEDADHAAYEAQLAADRARTTRPEAAPAGAGMAGVHPDATQGQPVATSPPANHLDATLAAPAGQPGDELPFGAPPWVSTPLGREVMALADALTDARKKFSLPADDATEADLTGWISSKRGLLRQAGMTP